MKRSHQILLAIFAVSAIVYFPFSHWIATTSVGTMDFIAGQAIYLFPMLAAIPAIPVLVICIFFQRTRRDAKVWLPLSILIILCCFAGNRLGWKIRMAAMESFALRSQSLLAAIQGYETDHLAPPPSLMDLVPEYLPSVPSTGMMAYPDFEYIAGERAQEQYAGNRWILSVYTPSGGINFDGMYYLPDQNYSDLEYSDSLERVGDWRYFHE